MQTLSVTSPVFSHNQPIPSKYTCDGENSNPPLTIGGIPEDTQSLVLIMDDPDAPVGVWDHWVLFNIQPATSNEQEANYIVQEGKEPDGTRGTNSWSDLGYGGPCPGSGEHHYYFKVYALDTKLELTEGALKEDIEAAMEGQILAEGVLIGVYERA